LCIRLKSCQQLPGNQAGIVLIFSLKTLKLQPLWRFFSLLKNFKIPLAFPIPSDKFSVPFRQNANGCVHGKFRDCDKMKARLYEKYKNDVLPALKEKRKYKNVHQIPRLEKIVVNMGVSASLEKGAVDDASKDLSLITGRKPAISMSRHSIAQFKLRENQPIGCRVTLRKDAMYEFFDRLVATALPRIRDFRGLSPRKFDGRGNYTFGISDQTIFPEIEMDKIKRTQGMDVTIVTSAPTNEEALDLLKMMGFPFAEK
jgi:large subunit ribosomal protein L5